MKTKTNKKDGKNGKKKKHGMISNIAYAIGNIWKWDKFFYLFFLPSIPISVILPLASNYFPKVLIDSVSAGENAAKVILIICIYFGALCAVTLLNSFCFTRMQMRRYSFSSLYQHALKEKHMRTDYSNTDNPEAINMYQYAMGDACSGNCSPEFIFESLLGLATSLLGIFTYGSVISMLSPLILVLLIASTLITYFMTRFQQKYIEKKKVNWVNVDREVGYLQSFSERFDHAKDIRIYGMLGWLSDMLSKFQKEQFRWTKKLSALNLGASVVNFLLTLIRDGAAYAVLIVMVLDGRIGAGDFVFYFSTITGFSAWLNGIAANINDVTYKCIKIDYYRDYFEIEEKFNHGEGCPLPTPDEIPVDIEFDNVSFKYASAEEDKYALKNVNLKIGRGEKLAIVGPNGAGKTTLVKLMCGFYYPTEGEIRLNGHSIPEYNIEDYYSLFTAVFQDLYLLPVSIAEFVSSSDSEVNRARVEDVLRKAGLWDKIESLPKGIDSRLMKGVFDDSIEMSGGESQKLMLARALYKDAPVIVLDEPTAALDPIAENELYLKYSDLTENKTSVYISHRLASTRFCDRIIYVENGEIVESGSHDELMKLGGKYAYMFDVQSHYYKEDGNDA